MLWIIYGHFIAGFIVVFVSSALSLYSFKRITLKEVGYAIVFFIFGYLSFIFWIIVCFLIFIEKRRLKKKEGF